MKNKSRKGFKFKRINEKPRKYGLQDLGNATINVEAKGIEKTTKQFNQLQVAFSKACIAGNNFAKTIKEIKRQLKK